jgi:hypothetical protein
VSSAKKYTRVVFSVIRAENSHTTRAAEKIQIVVHVGMSAVVFISERTRGSAKTNGGLESFAADKSKFRETASLSRFSCASFSNSAHNDANKKAT